MTTFFGTRRGCLEKKKKKNRHSRVLTLETKRRNEAEDSLTLPESQRSALRSASCPFAGANRNGSKESEFIPGFSTSGRIVPSSASPRCLLDLHEYPRRGEGNTREQAPQGQPRKF